MSLPKKIRPEYNTTLSDGQKVKYMPFTVREEKILVLAAESEDTNEITNAIINTLNICISEPSDLKIETLPLFDIQLLFLKCRSKSAGEMIKVNVTDPDDKTYTVEHQINVDKIQLERNKNHTNLIQLDDTTTVKMNYPGIKFFAEGLSLDGVVNLSTNIHECISQIVVGDEVFNRADMTDSELEEWIDDLTKEDINKFMEFFTTMPFLKHKITLKNPNTEKKFTITLEGLQDFF